MPKRLYQCLACGGQYQQLNSHGCPDVGLSEPIERLREKPLTMKSCLRCDCSFMSEGAYNRLCDACREEPIEEEHYYFAPVERAVDYEDD